MKRRLWALLLAGTLGNRAMADDVLSGTRHIQRGQASVTISYEADRAAWDESSGAPNGPLILTSGTVLTLRLTHSVPPNAVVDKATLIVRHLGGDAEVGSEHQLTFTGEVSLIGETLLYRTPITDEQGQVVGWSSHDITEVSMLPDLPMPLVEARAGAGRTIQTFQQFHLGSFDVEADIEAVCPSPDDPGLLVPRPGVSVRMIVSNSSIATPWAVTDSTGHAQVSAGEGGDPVALRGQCLAPAIYVRAEARNWDGSACDGYLPKFLTFPDRAEFEGTLNVTATDFDNHPLPAAVTVWGGQLEYGNERTTVADSTGPATFTIGTGSETWQTPVTLIPRVVIGAGATQHVDQPPGGLEAFPLLLSPDVSLMPSAHSYAGGGSDRFTLRAFDTDSHTTQAEVRQSIKHPNAINAADQFQGRHRVYLEVPVTRTLRHFAVQAVAQNADPGRREDVVIAGTDRYGTLVVATHEPRRPQIQIEYVICRVGSWAAASSGFPASFFLPPSVQLGQSQAISQFMPCPVNFTLNSSWAPASGSTATFSFGSEHLHELAQALQAYRARSTGLDLVIGIVPPGYLHTHSLLGNGGAAGLSFGDVPNAVLLDPTLIKGHHALHEFLHTLGLVDLDHDSAAPPSANGYDLRRRTPVVNVEGAASYPQWQAIMYDNAMAPWPNAQEYGTMLNFSSHLIGERTTHSDPATEVMTFTGVISGGANPEVQIAPVFTDLGEVYRPREGYSYGDYYLALIGPSGEMLDVAYFNKDEQGGNPWGDQWNPESRAHFFVSLPSHPELREVHIGHSNGLGALLSIWKSVAITPHAPQVSITGPDSPTLSGDVTVTWHATDADFDALTSALQISLDDGASWRPVATAIPHSWSGDYSHTFRASDHPSSATCRFRVLVTDGLRTSSAISPSSHSLQGYDPSPRALLLRPEFVAEGQAPMRTVVPVPIRNTGRSSLSVQLDPSSLPAWLTPLPGEQRPLLPGEERVLELSADLATAGQREAAVRLETSDPGTPSLDYPVRLTVDDQPHAPSTRWLSASLPVSAEFPTLSGQAITFSAHVTGPPATQARITVHRLWPPAAAVDEIMEPATQPGLFRHTWTVPESLEGLCEVEVHPFDSSSGLEDSDGWRSGPDLMINLRTPNRLPQFTAPSEDPTEVSANVGEQITLSYAVADPDGDTLDLALGGFSHPVRWDPSAQVIRWIPNLGQSGTHELRLVARDEHGASSIARWRLVITDPWAGNYPERAYPDFRDGQMLGEGIGTLSATCFVVAAQQGCRLEWRRLGTSEWNSTPLVPYTVIFEGLQVVSWQFDTSSLVPGAEYEFQAVNVNASGVSDPSPIVVHLFAPLTAGTVTEVRAPRRVPEGSPFEIGVVIRNDSPVTWTSAAPLSLQVPEGADPFTATSEIAVDPWIQIPPGSSTVVRIRARAPAAEGEYTTRWQLVRGGLPLGAASAATVAVLPADLDHQIIEHLLGVAPLAPARLAQSDVNDDQRIDTADVVSFMQIAGQVCPR